MSLRNLVSRLFRGSSLEPRKGAPAAGAKEQEESDDDDPFPEVVVIPFRDVLDLHSIPPKQVRAVVEGYLDEAHEHRAPGVRIIHGKGIGVQREIVRSILGDCPYVRWYGDAPMEAGGWGATVVKLDVEGGD